MDSGSKTNNAYVDGKVKLSEKIGYSLGGSAGGNFIYVTIASFATLYYTSSLGISAAVVGTMMLLARLLDGASDIAMGAIIDKTRTPFGKARPWYLISILPLTVSLLLVFNVPENLGMTGKIVYMYVTYIFSAVIAFTMMSLSHNSMLMLMTGNPTERIFLTATSNALGFIVIIVINALTFGLVENIGWSNVALIYAGVGFVLLTVEGALCQEKRHLTGQEELQTPSKKVEFKKALPNLIRNRYFFIVIALSVLNYLIISVSMGAGIFYCIHLYGDGNLFGLVTIVGMAPTILFLPFVVKVATNLGKKNTLILGYALQAVGYGLVFFTPGAFAMMIVGLVIKAIGLAMIAALLVPLIGDVIDYGEYRTGIRLDGITLSASSFGTKMGTGVGSAILGWGLALGGFDETLAVQSDITIQAINVLFSGIPAVCAVISIIVALWFTLEKHELDIRTSLMTERRDA